VKIEYTHPLPEKFDLVITARAFGPNANRLWTWTNMPCLVTPPGGR